MTPPAAITIDELPSRRAFEGRPPEHLFHYTDLDGVKGIFTSKSLWLSKFTASNDISEILLAIQHFQSYAAREAGRLGKPEGDFLLEAAAQLENFRRTNICVASFCEQHDLLSQWRSYGNDGRGIALGFSSAKLSEFAARNHLRLMRCVYDRDTHERIAGDLVTMLLKSFRAGRPGTPEARRSLLDHFNATFLLVAPVIKDHRFAEEQEWRLVSDPVDFDDPGVIAVLKGNQASVKLSVKLTTEAEALSGLIDRVTIGPTLDPHNVSDAIEVLSQRNGFHISAVTISAIPYRRIPE